MDEVTKSFLADIHSKYPGYAIRLTHKFLDGAKGTGCGFIPNEPIKGVVLISGAWW